MAADLFYFQLVNDEWFRIRIIFKDGVIAAGYSGGVVYGSPQFKTDALPALPAKGETSTFQQGGFVHQPVGRMRDPINSTFRHYITRLVFLLHPLFFSLDSSPGFGHLPNTKRLLILLTRPEPAGGPFACPAIRNQSLADITIIHNKKIKFQISCGIIPPHQHQNLALNKTHGQNPIGFIQ